MASGNMLDRIAGGSATYAVFEFAQPVSGGKSVQLKDAGDALFMQYTADNAFKYLVVSVNTMTAGDYTLWVDDMQMAHSGGMTGGMGFGGRGGMGGQLPEDFDPAQMQRPDDRKDFDPAQMEGMTPPEGFEGRQLPEDFDPAQMQRPEGMTPPEGGFGGRGQDGMTVGSGQQSEVFSLVQGGNRFSGVSVYTAAET